MTFPVPPEDLQIPRDVYLAQACANAAADAPELIKLIGRPPNDGEVERVTLIHECFEFLQHDWHPPSLFIRSRASFLVSRRYQSLPVVTCMSP